MKKFSVLTALLLSFAACSSPLLRWIEAPGGVIVPPLPPVVPGAVSFGIIDFSFEGVTGTKTIIGDPAALGESRTLPIAVTVPPGTILSSLTPVISYNGDFLTGPGFNNGKAGDGPATKVGSPQSFTNPQIYRVTDSAGAVREYEVRVFVGDSVDSKQITGFYFTFSGSPLLAAEGIIDETAKTIAVTVPYGTDLGNLIPEIYHTGDSVSPLSGAPRNFRTPQIYTVKALNGSTQDYRVTVFVDANSAKGITDFGFHGVDDTSFIIGSVPGDDGKLPLLVTIPYDTDITRLQPVITHEGDSVGGPGITAGGAGKVTGSPVDFTGPQSYTITAANGSTQEYAVTVINASLPPPPDSLTALINSFYFESPLALGTINQSAGTITVTVPHGTNLTALTPFIHYTGAKITQGSAESSVHPARLGTDFSEPVSPVSYTVTSQAGNINKTYQVTVTAALNSAKEITALSFDGIDQSKTTTVIGSAPNNTPIVVTIPLPITGTVSDYLRNLRPVITHTGVSITGPGVPASGDPTVTGSAVNFNSPQSYTVKAENGSTRTYVVSVRAADNDIKKITGFYFENPLAFGDIDEPNKKISVTVPYEYRNNLGALKPTVYFDGVSLSPPSGVVKDFTNPVYYTVTAANGTVQPYTVTVTALPNSAKDITAFTFPGFSPNSVKTVIGSVPGQDGYIPIAVTVPENANLSSLAPTITHTGSSISHPSGSPQNFNVPVSYTVTAQDGTTKDYKVEVFRQSNNARIITGFTFLSVPAANGVPVVGAIDQTAHTITVYVPYEAGTNLTNLRAQISFVGQSVRLLPSGTAQTANPLIDTRNWDLSITPADPKPKFYRVTAEDGISYQDYEVTVWAEEQNLNLTVGPIIISDPSLIRTNVSGGLLTVELSDPDDPNYTHPYEWYLDGKKLTVSSTEPRLSLKLADLKAGKHELVLVVTGPPSADGSQPSLFYTNKVYFTVNE
jgi:hypothetical protein